MGRCTSIGSASSIMSSYERFAYVYDTLMADIPYVAYADWVSHYAPSEHFPTLLDVGCGTGVLSLLFAEKGYTVSGLDLSEDMLAIAAERFQEAHIDIPLFCMSMDELDGFQEVDVITIAIDSFNYVKEQNAVIETLKRIFEALRVGGQLFFDVHSIYKMDEVFLNGPFTYDDGEMAYIWHTEPGEYEHSVYHQMTFFAQLEQSDFFERFDEEHFQRTFPVTQYIEWLQGIGFSIIEVTADWTEEAPTDSSERIFIRAVK